jgi:outer membrane protein assembly factor BamD
LKKCLALVCFSLAACAGANEIAETPALEDIYAAAYDKAGDKNYDDAARMFADAEAAYPASPWAADALVMSAYSSYLAGKFADAITMIDRFMRFHPGHRDVAYVMYLRGMCFYRQVSDVRREPGMSAHALSAFAQLAQRFPKSEYAKNAENKMVILKNYMAGKIMYSARREMARQNYPVVISSLQGLITRMPETQMTPEALFRLAEAYRAIGLPEQAGGFSEMLRLNFPDGDWAKKSNFFDNG